MTPKGQGVIRGQLDLLYDPKSHLDLRSFEFRTPLGTSLLLMTKKGHRVIRGRRDLLYDPKGHGDLCGQFDLVYDPKRSRGH